MITAAHDRTLAASSSVVGWNLRLLPLSTHYTTELEGRTSTLWDTGRNAAIYGIPSQGFRTEEIELLSFLLLSTLRKHSGCNKT